MQIKKADIQLFQTLGRKPNITEIAEAIDASPKQNSECLNAFRPLVPLELGIGEEGETQLHEILPDERISPQEDVDSECLRSDLQDLLATLKPNQHLVLMGRTVPKRENCTLRNYFNSSNSYQLTVSA